MLSEPQHNNDLNASQTVGRKARQTHLLQVKEQVLPWVTVPGPQEPWAPLDGADSGEQSKSAR